MLHISMKVVIKMRLRGERLRDLRESRGYSRERLAELLGIGTNPIYLYETEKSDPASAVVASIAQLFGVSTDYLLGFTDDPGIYISGDLSPKERAAIAAWRCGKRLEAIMAIASEDDGNLDETQDCAGV